MAKNSTGHYADREKGLRYYFVGTCGLYLLFKGRCIFRGVADARE